jgi:RNA:NAD 2'-phosphotransferase (TPT1/KptA family)
MLLQESDKGRTMSTYTVRGLLTGAVYGRHLSKTEAASVVLRHAPRRFAIRQADEGYYLLWIAASKGAMATASHSGRPIGARAQTKEAAWPAIACQVVKAD